MPYVDKLKYLTEWYRQIWAESLGKNGFGITPIDAMGTVDQHSQLQLYIDGPKNKFYTFYSKFTLTSVILGVRSEFLAPNANRY